MAFALGFAGGFADLIEAPPPVRQAGSGGGLGFRWPQPEPWTPPQAPAPPPPCRGRVVARWPYCTTTATVTGVAFPATVATAGYRLSSRLVGPPWLAYAAVADRRAREAQELAELALVLEVWR